MRGMKRIMICLGGLLGILGNWWCVWSATCVDGRDLGNYVLTAMITLVAIMLEGLIIFGSIVGGGHLLTWIAEGFELDQLAVEKAMKLASAVEKKSGTLSIAATSGGELSQSVTGGTLSMTGGSENKHSKNNHLYTCLVDKNCRYICASREEALDHRSHPSYPNIEPSYLLNSHSVYPCSKCTNNFYTIREAIDCEHKLLPPLRDRPKPTPIPSLGKKKST